MDEAAETIRKEVNKIIEKLRQKANIELREIKTVNYGIKYEVTNLSDNKNGIMVLYHGKKGFRFVYEKNISKDTIPKIEEIFKDRDKISDTSYKIKKQENVNYKFLNKLYNALKPYENEEFDFSQFAEELKKNFSKESDKIILEKNKYKFSVLEKYYKVVKRDCNG